MSGPGQLEKLLPAPSRAGKAQLLRIVVQDPDDIPLIDSDTGVSSGEPRIAPPGGSACSADAANPARTA
jgi:hypothetical protein